MHEIYDKRSLSRVSYKFDTLDQVCTKYAPAYRVELQPFICLPFIIPYPSHTHFLWSELRTKIPKIPKKTHRSFKEALVNHCKR
jgi:hypothetical protein